MALARSLVAFLLCTFLNAPTVNASEVLFRRTSSRMTRASEKLRAKRAGATSRALARKMLDADAEHPSFTDVVRKLSSHVNAKKAAKQLMKRKLPRQVAALVESVGSASGEAASRQPFDEASMDKARGVLNEMVEKSWSELDDKLVQCREFEERNRGIYDQVASDLARLGEEVADLMRLKGEAADGIQSKELEIKEIEEQFKNEETNYRASAAEFQADMTTRRNDLDVFQFILSVTRCEGTTMLMQSKGPQSDVRVCHTSGGPALRFSDEKLQAKYKQLETPAARQAIGEALMQQPQHGQAKHPKASLLAHRGARTVHAHHVEGAHHAQHAHRVHEHREHQDHHHRDQRDHHDHHAHHVRHPHHVHRRREEISLLQLGEDPAEGEASEAPEVISINNTVVVAKEPVAESCEGPSCWRSCPAVAMDCGMMHDKMSLLWGKFKDLVDELQMDTNKNDMEWVELKENMNQQIRGLANSKGRFSMQLAESASNLQANHEEAKQKDEQKQQLNGEYHRFMTQCKKRITWIMYQDMCSLIVVRNAILQDSTSCAADQITDCDVDAWIPEECSVSCDNSCPDPHDIYGCGGWQAMQRKILTAPDSCGLRCPELTKWKKCNQVNCPVDCEMSEWSGFSKCSKECEGGVKLRTRSILGKPKNGGTACDTVEETTPCNTGSCDRDCTLSEWTAWTGCSVACGGGVQEKQKHVLIPIRGYGKCPKETSDYRYNSRACNEQGCQGDELCMAKQDLIIAVDGSGSISEDGFTVLKGFAAKLVDRYQSEYFGELAVQIGVVQFGNGVVMEDDTVSPAVNVQPITADLAAAKSAIEGLTLQKGFTNMAQAFALSETMFTRGARKGALSAVLVITDGKPSFEFQTAELVTQLQDKGVQRYFAVVTDYEDDGLQKMKEWASAPWETNVIHVPGIANLRVDEDVFVEKALTKFCPMAFSPSLMEQEDQTRGYMLVRDGGYCGGRGALLSSSATDAAACAAYADGAGASAFLLGTWFRRGYCYASDMAVDAGQYSAWEGARVAPACASGWVNSMVLDFYAMAPAQ